VYRKVARMRGTMLAHKSQHVGGKTGRAVPVVATLPIVARMQHAPSLPRYDAVSVEEILLQRQPRELPMYIAIAIFSDTMAQDQVLGAGRRTDRIGLHEAHGADRLAERRRRAKRRSDRHATQTHQGQRLRHVGGIGTSACR
jgi:hypothetical protein